jgi:hypothetical protein
VSIYLPVRDEMVRHLSQPRLNRYKSEVGGDLQLALKLYAWNLRISAAFLESIHYFEVALRNMVDRKLTSWAADLSGTSTGISWYSNPVVPLSDKSQGKVKIAIKSATNDGKQPEVHDKVIAELSLGFWWSLLAESYNDTLWSPCLRYAFASGSIRRQRLHDAVDDIRKLRNRIAHHEPIFGNDLVETYRNLLDTAERLSPRLAWWIDATSRVGEVLDDRPSLGCPLQRQPSP